jgi:hypothetical protein
MKKPLLIVIAAFLAIGMVGCKSGEDTDTAAAPTPGAGTTGETAVANPNKPDAGQAALATPSLSPNATDDRWKAGTMAKGGGK